jgi:hypothetical protein
MRTSYKIKNYIPVSSEAVANTQYTFTGLVHALRADVDGVCYARLTNDTEFRQYTIAAGQFAFGEFVEVLRGTFTAATLIGVRFPLE